MDTASYRTQRRRMVERQLRRRGIADIRVLAAMEGVAREMFVPARLREQAYADKALQIDAGQTISQPFVVARMLELASLGPNHIVLEVGAGSGYAAAVISRIAQHVVALERHGQLARAARATLRAGDFGNVAIIEADGTRGYVDEAPYDAIVVSAGGQVPPALRQQLKVGGRLVIPVGDADLQRLEVQIRKHDGTFRVSVHDVVTFVPLVPGLPEG